MERIMVGVTIKDRKSTNWIRKQNGVTDTIRNIRESKHRWAGCFSWREEVITDGQSDLHDGYPVDINDLEADQKRDGLMT